MDEQRVEKEIRQRTVFVGAWAVGVAVIATVGAWMTLDLVWPLRLLAAPALGVAALIITWLVVTVMLGEIELVWPFSRSSRAQRCDRDSEQN